MRLYLRAATAAAAVLFLVAPAALASRDLLQAAPAPAPAAMAVPRVMRSEPYSPGSNAVPPQCSMASAGNASTLKLGVDTVSWGYYYNGLTPAAVVSSGDTITVEMASHESGNAYDLMVQGDPAMEAIFAWDGANQGISLRGAWGGGEGVHLLTGPIYVCGAQPGDILKVEILDLKPRINPASGKTFGSNTAGNWGYHYRFPFLNNDKREVVTIYEVKSDAQGNGIYAQPDHQFRWANARAGDPGVVSPCTPTDGEVPRTAENGFAEWQNEARLYPKGLGFLPCSNNATQTWPQYTYPGCITPVNKVKDTSCRGKWRSPVNFHVGNMGLATKEQLTVNSIPPTSTIGGNMDQRRLGRGSTMYYKVQVEGGLLSMGDCHAAMGDSELDGTGIETSATGTFRLTVIKQNALPPFLSNFKAPIMENINEFIVHGFTYNDYLAELPEPQTTIFGRSTLDRTMQVTYNNTRDFMIAAFNLTEDQAISAMTVGVDFGITQVVDGNWGIHAIIPKWMFNMSAPGAAYIPQTISGTSVSMNEVFAKFVASGSVATATAGRK